MDLTWHAMPEQQHQAIGDPGSLGGPADQPDGGRGGRDRQDRARETREKETGSPFGKGRGRSDRNRSLGLPPSLFGVLAEQALPQIANEIASIFTGAPDVFPNAPPDTSQRGEGNPDPKWAKPQLGRRPGARRSFATSPFAQLGGGV